MRVQLTNRVIDAIAIAEFEPATDKSQATLHLFTAVGQRTLTGAEAEDAWKQVSK